MLRTEARAQECWITVCIEDIQGQSPIEQMLTVSEPGTEVLIITDTWGDLRIGTIIMLERRMEATYAVADSNVQR